MNELFNNKIKPGLIWFAKSFIWLGLLMLIIDIVTKNVIIANRDAIKASSEHGVVLIPHFLAINYVINTGAAFGLSTGNKAVDRIVYIVIATLALAALIGFFVKKELEVKKGKGKELRKYYKACIFLILAGAIGNLIDRIAYTPEYLAWSDNGVVDWINFFGIWGYNFNIADSCLVIGVIMVIVMLIIEEIQDTRQRNATIRKNIAAEKAKKEAEAAQEKPAEEEPKAEEAKEETSK